MTRNSVLLSLGVVVLALSNLAAGVTAAFDLSGPPMEVKVTRAGKTLPIAEVPNLQPGDRIWVHPEMPESQSVHYLMIAAFLRGPTNPPPDKWFIKAETWSKQLRDEGIVITVPKDAQQVLIFLAPETGGDFSALRTAVAGRPGAFVRASQDLNQASLDRTRLDKYLERVRELSSKDPKVLHDRTVLLARSLNIKLDQACFDRPVEQQAFCLTQNSDQLVLDDGHSQSMVATLTTGTASDLIGQMTASPMARSGYYSAYVGAVVDIARLLSSYHSPDYQYIPALALPQHEELNLKLNNPPSFRKPKSVMVVGMPGVVEAQFPPVHPVNPDSVACLQRPPVVLAAEGAPLVFSTDLAHDLVLHIDTKPHGVDLPVIADASQGGFVVDTHNLQAGKLEGQFTGTIQGYWGFQPFTGPSFHVSGAHSEKWAIAAGDQKSLIVGRADALRLQGDDTACVDNVTIKDAQGKMLPTSWKIAKSGELQVEVPLENASPGELTVAVQQVGLAKPDEITVSSFSEAAHLDRFTLNAGDQAGMLEGNRLDEVAGMELQKVHFVPAALARADEKDQLQMQAPTAEDTVALGSEKELTARVMLKDGRTLEMQTAVAPPRPKVKLMSKSLQVSPDAAPAAVRLVSPDDVPQNASLSFFIKTEVPSAFPRTEKIEVAAVDDSFHVMLSLSDRTLNLQDSETVLATLDPQKNFGPSAFGPIRFRPVSATGVAGDWEALANLVRIPSLKEVRCPDNPDKPCALNGSDLFLIDSVSSTSHFTHPTTVPLGFADSSLSVPRPLGTILYIKLRDDPSVINPVALPVLPAQ
jgi:hypothetical protein